MEEAAMNEPKPGLRQPVNHLRNRSNDMARVELRVPAGATIDTDDPDVIAQLLANSAFVTSERARQDAKAAAEAAAEAKAAEADDDDDDAVSGHVVEVDHVAVEEAGGGSARRASGRRN
jgi:hypothetical protein